MVQRIDSKRLTLEHTIVQPTRRRYAVPLLLLHGAWHGAWCWQAAQADFAERGFEVHAISLRGHGASDCPRSFNLCSVNDYVRDLAVAVESIHPRPIVVAHSMGGYILQRYLMEERLPRAVLLCSVPIMGILAWQLRYLAQQPVAVLSGTCSLNLQRLVGTPALARAAFFRETIAPTDLERYSAQIGRESYRVALELLFGRRPDPNRVKTPLLAIAAGSDQIFTLEEERITADAYGAELIVIPEAAHDLMLDPAWPLAADVIERFAAHGSNDPSTS